MIHRWWGLARCGIGALALLVVSGRSPLRAQTSPALDGVVTVQLTTLTSEGPRRQMVEYLTRAGAVRVNLAGPMGPVALLALPQEPTVFLLLGASQSYAELPRTVEGASGAATEATVIRTGRRETIAGVVCEHVTVIVARDSTDLCRTTVLGRFLNPAMGDPRSGSGSPWTRAVAARVLGTDGFPLKITLPDGQVPWLVTRIERKRLADDLFTVPLTYTKMRLPSRR